MADRLAGRTVLVTGASRGIGAAAARGFAKTGARVAAAARTRPDLETLVQEIRADGGEAASVVLDVTDREAIARLPDRIARTFGGLDVFVGNAGILIPPAPIGAQAADAWETVMAVNATANWHLIRALHPLLARSDAGRVVFVTSGIAEKAFAGWAPYAASKRALETLARVYANEVAESPVRVNLVDPGQVRTALHARAVPDRDPA